MSKGEFREFVFEVLSQWRQSGLKTALLTLVNVEGSSPRPVGSQLAVNEHGDCLGLISGGCLESALAEEAQLCIQANTTKCVRFGRDSDYFDIQLPCGSGLDILIQPIAVEDGWVEEASRLFQSRQPFCWAFDLNAQVNTLVSEGDVHDSSNPQLSREQMDATFSVFQKNFLPRHRVVVVGAGEVFDSFIRLVQPFDLDLFVYPLKRSMFAANGDGGLGSYSEITDWEAFTFDSWSSLAVLSHEHLWELAILQKALASDVSYICALGSKKAQSNRLRILAENGAGEGDLERVKGPAGLDLGGKNPPEIALSILSELIVKKNRCRLF